MRCLRWMLFLVVLGVAACAPTQDRSRERNSPTTSPCPTTGPVSLGFSAVDDKTALIMAEEIEDHYSKLERDLNSQLLEVKGPLSDYRKACIIRCLGTIRSDWAVATLIERIDFKGPSDGKEDGRAFDPWSPAPAVDALTQIGTPSVWVILHFLEKEEDPERIESMLVVIWQVEGRNPGEAWLKDAVTKAQSEAAKKNLRKALDRFKERADEWEHPKGE